MREYNSDGSFFSPPAGLSNHGWCIAEDCRRLVPAELAVTRERLAMPLQFHRAVEQMEIWSATCDGYSFVISFESFAGPGFHGRPGYVGSWRPLYQGRGAIKIIGSPFKSFDEAEAACDAMLKHLTND